MKSPNLKIFAGKRALITGSTQGLGLAVARRLASSGCDVVLHGLGDRDAISAVQRQIEAECGVQTFYSPANLQDPSAIESMMQQAQQALGPIDILINTTECRDITGAAIPIDGGWSAM